jgi:hypothetical protein
MADAPKPAADHSRCVAQEVISVNQLIELSRSSALGHVAAMKGH